MTQTLGYARYVAHGSDWGSLIAGWLGFDQPEACAGIHMTMILGGLCYLALIPAMMMIQRAAVPAVISVRVPHTAPDRAEERSPA